MTKHSPWASHLVQDVLPWWEAHGADDEHGGVRTGFDNNGEPTTSDRFTWSQGRWAWLSGELADEVTAGRLDLDAALWRDRCLATCERLLAHAVREDGRTHFRVTEAGEPVPDDAGETATSVFADLFCVLGLSAGLRQLPDADARLHTWSATANHILSTARRSIEDRTATAEPYPVPDGFTDLAGPMTLLHVAAELLGSPVEDASVARSVRDWAGGQLATVHLGDGRWREFAPTRPGLDDTLLARHVTPGHLLEVLWMIEHAEAEDPDFHVLSRPERLALVELAITVGWDETHGGVLRYTDRDGGIPRGEPTPGSPYETLVSRTWGTKLWWVHVEAVYALALYARESDAIARWASRAAEWTMKVFPSPGAEWIQIRDRAGAPFNEVVALPVKDPFHIIRSLIFLNRLS
ncbi:N-acylglucosamine 2-epimerase [Propioniciclava sinopodophylli]|uniref:N-acylglucosamine 2-epimerase n=1 Tax=Propioniciclava sinopodophylli TaxID=1837344 RepID=A0A4Q9KC04_9ACTN|nr:AGE family epimerase/isomerase [Propioniciclava sinopodophylli]TBT82985.1 N-acylglucosamine 2-epimerase [Propioniciclava sinopodophylli]